MAVRRSFRASPAGIEKAKTALFSRTWSQRRFAKELGLCTKWSVSQFFRGKNVDRQIFVNICQKLNLDWQDIAEPEQQTETGENIQELKAEFIGISERLLIASPAGIEKATTALISKAWTHAQLAKELNLCTCGAVFQFFKGKTVERQTFVKICQKLALDWQDISEPEQQMETGKKRVSYAAIGTVSEGDIPKLKLILALLQDITGDTSIKIVDIEKGSIRLVLEGSQESLKKIEVLFKSGQLTEIGGVLVEDVQFVTPKISKYDENIKAIDKKQLAFTIAGSISSEKIQELKAEFAGTSERLLIASPAGIEKVTTATIAGSVMTRSIRVAPECISQVKRAQRHRFAIEDALALDLGIPRHIISNFYNGRRVARWHFVTISERLGLDWRAIANKEDQIEPPPPPIVHPPPPTPQPRLDIDTLVQEVRQACHDKIQMLYGKMQLLDISQPVDIDNLYVDVNILEEITSNQWRELSDLLQDFNPDADNFDRLGLGKVRQQRVSGLDAVTEHSRLMVLGKPGAGKTTFLKHIAIECNKGEFQGNLVPIFIPLKIFAEDARGTGDFGILQYIHQEFASCGVGERAVTEEVLNQGRGLILLDGLDEVPEENSEEVVRQIRDFARNYFNNRFIITCRIAAHKYRFKDVAFTDVEVADFNDKQIEDFAKNWFVAFAKDNQEKGLALASQFIEKLNRPENQQIRELAVTPILLNLTCLVFQAKGDFPSKRSKLYEQGLDILLRRWDEAKGIKPDKVYRNLDVEHKKELLSQVAAITFERGNYFFEQNQIQGCIADYLRTLPNAKTDRARLQRDSEAVLKAIEAQHGLLVERARDIYSFSHLTFQEYFTARYFVESSDPQALENLSSHITEKRWREVFLLTTEMLPNAEG